MHKKRIIVCLDVRNGKVTKGVRFKGNKDIGDPVEFAQQYYEQGVDELVFYDITASLEKRGIMQNVVKRVTKNIFIPFSVGGGIGTIEDMYSLLLSGAEKISVNSLAVLNPAIITQGARRFGSQCIVLGIDACADKSMPSGYRVVIKGGREHTDKDVLAWAKEAEDRGIGEIVLNSIDADGTQNGYECNLIRSVSEIVSVPVVASGGAGIPKHLVEVFCSGKADAALVASMVHYGSYTIGDIKAELVKNKIAVRQ